MNTTRFNRYGKTALLCNLLAALFLIIIGSGCRKETDEFRRRPLSNGKVFIQIGGRKWMIDDSFPSLFSGDNEGRINAPRGEYVTFDTLNSVSNMVVSFAFNSKNKNGDNVSGRLSIYYKNIGNHWNTHQIFGSFSSHPTNNDSIFQCSKIIESSYHYTNRLNLGWHNGEIQFEAETPNSKDKKIVTIKYILKS